ncbi:MAG: rhamnulose-1-phosphate aldolase [Oscillospiraceae bacterium]|nr:rhamnulose-1-phosphate aldolase [Oscillospiraceae bacterium]
MSMLDAEVVQEYIRMCDDGWLQGWHERNAGNLTYRLTEAEVEECEIYFDYTDDWVEMDISVENLAEEFFITTGAGKYFRNIALDAEDCLGVVEINEDGDAYRVVWGFSGGAVPTSEFPSHMLNHSIKKEATDGLNRIIYHAHPEAIVSLTSILPLTAKAFSSALWRTITECPIVFPAGVGVVEWMMPGAGEIAVKTSELMETFDAVVWAAHGMFVSGATFDLAFGLMHTIEKSARIYLNTISAGKRSLRTITDTQLRDIAETFDLVDFNYSLLD